MSDKLIALQEMRRKMQEQRKDSIPPDAVCVVSPTLWENLLPLTEVKQQWSMLVHGYEVWIIGDAPKDAVEFMSKETMFKRYADWFARQAQTTPKANEE